MNRYGYPENKLDRAIGNAISRENKAVVVMPEAPRTWTLVYDARRVDDYEEPATRVEPDDGVLSDGERVKVYEASTVDAERERMLELIERAREMMGAAHLVEDEWRPELHEYVERDDPNCRVCAVERDLSTLLREYDRLPKEGSDGD